jgi:hypothetical protein
MPKNVVELVEKAWERDLKDTGGQKLWPADKSAQR